MSQVAYEISGNSDGDLIIWLHGGGLCGRMWDLQCAHFRDYLNITVDLPGHGKSKNALFTIPSATEPIYAIIEKHRKDKKVYMVGFSLGAQVLVEYLSLNPNHIDKALIHSALVVPIPWMKLLSGPYAWLATKLSKRKFFLKKQAKALHLAGTEEDWFYETVSSITRPQFKQMLLENATYGLPSSFSEVKSDLFLLYGAKELKAMKQSYHALLNQHTKAQGRMVEGQTHGICLFSPSFFNEILRSFLEGTMTQKKEETHDARR